MRRIRFMFIPAVVFLLAGFCGCKSKTPATSDEKKAPSSTVTAPADKPPAEPSVDQPLIPKDAAIIQITTSAIESGGLMNSEYTCDGKDISPELKWRLIPAAAQSLALIMDDPDAPSGTWTHWVIYNIPANTGGFRPGVPRDETVAGAGSQGANSWDKDNIGYGGPCPPGGTHRYFFKLYALDAKLDLEPGASKAELEAAMKGRVIGFGQFVVRYSRNK